MTYFSTSLLDTSILGKGEKKDKALVANLAQQQQIHQTTNRGHEQISWSRRLRVRIDEFIASFEIDGPELEYA